MAKKQAQKKTKKSLKKQGSTEKQGSQFWITILLSVVVIFITYYCYKDVSKLKFTNWDDPAYVTESEIIDNGLTAENIKYIFTNPIVSNYHPLTIISLIFDYNRSVSGKKPNLTIDPAPFHKTNRTLHILATLLLFIFIYKLSRNKALPAFLVSLIFAIHPLHVESVAWISERKDVLYAVFFLAALITYLLYKDRGKFVYFIITVVLFILSLLSKPAAAIFPFVVIAIDYYRDDRLSIRNFKDAFTRLKLYFSEKKFLYKGTLEKAFLIFLGLAEIYITYIIQEEKAVADFSTFTVFQRLMFASYGFVMYLYKFLVPLKLSTFYPYPRLDSNGNIHLLFYISPLIVGIILFYVYRSMKITKLVIFSFLFYFFTVILVLQFVSVGRAIMADRYTYIPYIAIAFLIAMYYTKIINGKNLIIKTVSSLILAGWLIFLATTTIQQVNVWKTSETLWTQTIENYGAERSNDPIFSFGLDMANKHMNLFGIAEVAYKNRGNFYGKEQNKPMQALKDYQILVQLDTKESEVYSNLGNIYGMMKEYNKALESYSKSVSLNDKNLNSYINRGITYSMMGDFAAALNDFSKALELSPGNLKVYQNRAFALLQSGSLEESIADYDLLINKQPGIPTHYFYRGLAYYKMKKYNKAIENFHKSTDINPGYSEGYYNLSVCYYTNEEFQNALKYANKAKSLGYKVSQSYLDQISAKIGKTGQAN